MCVLRTFNMQGRVTFNFP